MKPTHIFLSRLLVWLLIGVTGILAAVARYQLIEPMNLGSWCNAQPGDAVCLLRTWLIAGFSNHGLGSAAFLASGLALWLKSATMAGLAAALGLAGMILYNHELAAPALLIGVLVLARRQFSAADTDEVR